MMASTSVAAGEDLRASKKGGLCKAKGSRGGGRGGKTIERFSREVEHGNTEYKWKLVQPSEERMKHLSTQLNWRLNESPNDEAVYLLGVQDDGHPEGISPMEFRESLQTLRQMAAGVNASLQTVQVLQGVKGKVARVTIRREECRCEAPLELRVAVLGNMDSGKSTLTAVLTTGALDNGRGLARMKVFRHNHEIENGRTSSINQHILGFDSEGRIANYSRGASPLSAEEIQQHSTKVINFIDLAGHEKYQKTTVSGMVGLSPDYALLTVAAALRLPPDTDTDTGTTSRVSSCFPEVGTTTEQHLGIALALHVPLLVVITKTDLAPPQVVQSTVATIVRLLQEAGKTAMVMEGTDEAESEGGEEESPPSTRSTSMSSDGSDNATVPIFLLSNVTGEGLWGLQSFLRTLPRSRPWDDARLDPYAMTEVHIDDCFEVDGVGTVVAGTIRHGKVSVGDNLLLGPDRVMGTFQPVIIKSMHLNRVAVRTGLAGQCLTFAVKIAPQSQSHGSSCHEPPPPPAPAMSGKHGHGMEGHGSPSPSRQQRRKKQLKGTVLVAPSTQPSAIYEFEAEVMVLNSSKSIKGIVNHEPVVHANTVRQSCKILSVCVNEGQGCDKALCRFRFLHRPEYLMAGMTILFREGRSLGVGQVTAVA